MCFFIDFFGVFIYTPSMTYPELIYYIQTNLICIMILTYLLFVNSMRFGNHATEDNIFSEIIFGVIVFCIADIFTWCVDGQSFRGAKTIIYISDCIYICMPPIMSYLWADYAYIKTKGIRRFGHKRGKIHFAVMLTLILLVLSSPWTKFAFYIDATNIYHRNIGAYLAPVAAWCYIIGVIAGLGMSALRRETRSDFAGLGIIIMLVAPAFIATIIQLLFYGVTLIQVGFTFSLLFVFVNRQKNMISLDELTRLNNRRELNLYYQKLLSSGNAIELCICVIDVNKFKQINDRYGHLEGDNALKVIASALRGACANVHGGWFMARYGGDEFIFAGTNKTNDDIDTLWTAVNREIDIKNQQGSYPYHIGVSFGCGMGTVCTSDNISDIMAIADERMYEDKKAGR